METDTGRDKDTSARVSLPPALGLLRWEIAPRRYCQLARNRVENRGRKKYLKIKIKHSLGPRRCQPARSIRRERPSSTRDRVHRPPLRPRSRFSPGSPPKVSRVAFFSSPAVGCTENLGRKKRELPRRKGRHRGARRARTRTRARASAPAPDPLPAWQIGRGSKRARTAPTGKQRYLDNR